MLSKSGPLQKRAYHKCNEKKWLIGSLVQYLCKKPDKNVCQMLVTMRENWGTEDGSLAK